MSTNLEFEDKNVEMAIKKACKELNIPKEKLKHDVISYGSTGIFGLVGTKRARIRVILPASISIEATDNTETNQEHRGSVKPEVKDTDRQPAAFNDERETEALSADAKHIGQDALQRIIDLITTDATIATDEKPDLVVLDINMPIMNGHDMLDGLRRNPDLRDTAVIMCTKSGEIQDVTKAMSFNIGGYVTKPFDYTELRERIVEILEDKASA